MLLARKVYETGIPTPKPGEYVVTEDGRYGIRFNRILGKILQCSSMLSGAFQEGVRRPSLGRFNWGGS